MRDKRILKTLVFDLDDTLFDSTNQPKEKDGVWPIEVFEGWLDILRSGEYRSILVTKGEPKFQNKKIDTLRIREFFADIHILETDEAKHESFKEIAKRSEGEIIVIGNRIDSEIRYGNMLGLRTVHIRHGKYADLKPKDAFEIPTHVVDVTSLSRLRDIL